VARFLFTVWPYVGHIHPNLAVAQALADRGHEPAFYTGSSARAAIESEGFRCFPFRRIDEGRLEEIIRGLDALSLDWGRVGQRLALLREWLLGTADAQIQDVTEVLQQFAPGAIVCDPAMWGPVLVLQEKARIPLAILSYVAACMLPGPEGPIVGLPLRAPRGWLGRLRRHALRSVADVLASGVRRGADDLRVRHGLPPVHRSVTEFAGRAPLYLVPSTPAFDRCRHDLPASVRYIGPCVWEKRDDPGPPAWLDELPGDRTVVYVTEGTRHSKPPLLLPAALQGLAEAPVRVVVTTGIHRDPDRLGLGRVPANARVEQWIAHRHLLPRADVVVTTGGAGTVLGALAAGLPLVVVPTAWDQPENAWRVVESGAGVRVAPRHCTPARIRASVERVLGDPSFRENARRLGRELATHRGAAEGAELLERLAPVVAGPARRQPAPITEVSAALAGPPRASPADAALAPAAAPAARPRGPVAGPDTGGH
jgi:MGT family glycosyltransferase